MVDMLAGLVAFLTGVTAIIVSVMIFIAAGRQQFSKTLKNTGGKYVQH